MIKYLNAKANKRRNIGAADLHCNNNQKKTEETKRFSTTPQDIKGT